MPYNCRLCGGTYCAEHRLPENHDCPGLDNWGDPGGVFDSGFDDGVANEGGSSGVLSSVGIDTGRGGPLGYFRGNMTFVFLGLMWVTFLAQLILQSVGLAGLATDAFILTTWHVTYVWTWFTSIFAHGGFFHIFFNSIVLYFFGPVVEQRIGSKRFTVLFLVSGAVAGLAQIGVSLFVGAPAAVIGASGAIMAILGVLTVLNPNLRVYLYFIIPMPLWVLTAGFAVLSVFFISAGGPGAGGIAQFAHLSGLAIGLGYGLVLKQQGERAPKQLQFGGGPGGPGGPGNRRF